MKILSPDCFQVKGYNRSTICDVRRQNFYEGPAFFNLQDINPDYFQFLEQNEVIINVPEKCSNQFLPISLKYDTYSAITNSVLFYGEHFFQSISLLTELRCHNFALIINSETDIYLYEQDVKKILSLPFNSIELHILDIECNSSFCDEINRLANNYVWMHPVLYTNNQKIIQYIYTSPNNRILCRCVSDFFSYNISYESFFCNIMFFTESQHYNTYYHRKIFIDKNGNISNTLHFEQQFGSIFQINTKSEMLEIVSRQDFQLLWKASKDKISVCKDCEYRHLCIDRRIPIKYHKHSWYFDTECNYNPYICKWKNEDGYMPTSECGTSTKETGFVPNHEKISKFS